MIANVKELQRITDILIRYVNKGTELKKLDLTRSAFVTFGYTGTEESTIHDIIPVGIVYYISKTLSNPNGYMLLINCHYMINKNMQKILLHVLDNATGLSLNEIIDSLKDLQNENPRAYGVIMAGLKSSIRRYDFHGIQTDIKVLDENELSEYLNIWSVPKFGEVIDDNDLGDRPLSEHFYNSLKG